MTGAEFHGVDVDLLADYIGGALDGTPDESVVATLIADDPAWRSAYESLSGDVASVVAELGRFEPEPMPAEVADRLEAALTEAAARPQLTLVRGNDAPPVQEKRKLRWVTPIAIAAGTVAFVGFGLDYLAGQEKGVSSSSSGSADSAARAQRDLGQEPMLSGSARSDAYAGQSDTAEGKAAAPPQQLTSGTNYTRATLAELAPRPMAASTATAPAPAAASAPRWLNMTATLEQCLDQIDKANGAGQFRAETVDYAKFDGKPAIVVRFTAANGSWAWASGPACGTPDGGADTLDKVPVR
ncbi:hypothetical protein [Actinoplanes subtropicus]|uniref:hypothetical protein n=1 Tax=Actinoplanes subtropicus TaxID=543632 RepID=UPI0004C3F337|nr:hypothetical protein [Actinoplanes subtropicus]